MFQIMRAFIRKITPYKLSEIFSSRKNIWQSQKRSKKIITVVAFIFVMFGTIGSLNYLNRVNATWNNLITWTSSSDFSTNAVTTGTATTNILVDTTSVSGSVKLIKTNDTGNTMEAGYIHSFVVKNDATL